jgi:hypothetical protein
VADTNIATVSGLGIGQSRQFLKCVAHKKRAAAGKSGCLSRCETCGHREGGTDESKKKTLAWTRRLLECYDGDVETQGTKYTTTSMFMGLGNSEKSQK